MSTPRPAGSRRRLEARPRRGVEAGAVWGVVLAVVAGVAVAAAVRAPAPEPTEPAAATAVPVTERTLVCPGESAGSSTLLAVPGAGDDTRGEAQVQGPGSGALTLERGVPATQRTPSGEARTVVATGDLAAGLVGQWQDRSGRSTGECPAAGGSWWFTGVGGSVDHRTTLELVNPESGAAIVDVRVFGPEGPIETLGTRGLTVEAGEERLLEIADLAPETAELAVEVRVSRGRVAAFAHDEYAVAAGGDPGAGLVPAQESPATSLTLAGIVPGSDRDLLVVANPSENEARVAVSVVGPDGTFVPTEDAELRVDPGAVATLDLTEELEGRPSALRLESTQPVTAVVRSELGRDVSAAGRARTFAEPAAMLLPRGSEAALLLSAESGATAEVVSYDAQGEQVAGDDVEIEAGTTSRARLPAQARWVQVTPGNGRVVGALVLTGSEGASSQPLAPLVITQVRPAVRPALP